MERKLYKSSENKVIIGVCGGIGEYFNIDPVIIRLAAVIFTLMGGSGIIAYIIAAFIMPSRTGAGSDNFLKDNSRRSGVEMPEYDKSYYKEGPEKETRKTSNLVLIILAVVVGIIALMIFLNFIKWMFGIAMWGFHI